MTTSSAKSFWQRTPGTVVIAWVIISVVLAVSGWSVGMETILPGPSALETLKRYPGEQIAFQEGIPPTDSLMVLVGHKSRKFDAPLFQQAVDSLVEDLKAETQFESDLPLFRSIRTVGQSVFVDDKGLFVSEDEHAVLIYAKTDIPLYASAEHFKHLPTSIAGWKANFPEFFYGYLSEGTGDNEIFDLINEDLDKSLIYTLPLTLVILLWAFRSLVAALIPLFIAVVSLSASLGCSAFFSHLSEPISATAAQLVVLLVLAIGVDYSLFMVSRVREELSKGRDYGDAVNIARSTTGLAILWSGMTVACSLFGLLLMNDTILTSMAHVSIIAVLYTVISTILVLPSLLLLLRRFIKAPKKRGSRERTLVKQSVRMPVVMLVASTGLMLLFSFPLKDIVLGSTMERDILPGTMQSAKAYALFEKYFPEKTGSSFWIILKDTKTDLLEDEEVVDEFFTHLVSEHPVSGPIEVEYGEGRKVGRYQFVAEGNGNVPENQLLVKKLRNEYIPHFLEPSGINGYVTGVLPFVTDEEVRYHDRTFFVIAVVLVLSFFFLLIAFHSIVIAIKALLLNVLSASAAFGLLVALFQSGIVPSWNYGVVETFVPALLFAILFGLSMDYHVFLLSRIREQVESGMSTRDSVEAGIVSTYRTITSAALIMAGVFFIIANLELPIMKQLGLGLAVAVLLDATVVRSILLPCTMVLLGEWNWYVPKWLKWLPKVSLD